MRGTLPHLGPLCHHQGASPLSGVTPRDPRIALLPLPPSAKKSSSGPLTDSGSSPIGLLAVLRSSRDTWYSTWAM